MVHGYVYTIYFVSIIYAMLKCGGVFYLIKGFNGKGAAKHSNHIWKYNPILEKQVNKIIITW